MFILIINAVPGDMCSIEREDKVGGYPLFACLYFSLQVYYALTACVVNSTFISSISSFHMLFDRYRHWPMMCRTDVDKYASLISLLHTVDDHMRKANICDRQPRDMGVPQFAMWYHDQAVE